MDAARAAGRRPWRRERSDPFPVTQFYLLAPPRQAEVLYDETLARDQLLILVPKDANQPV